MKTENITEQQVAAWLRAKLIAIRAGGFEVRTIDISVHWPTWDTALNEPVTNWSMHAHGECVVAQYNCESAIESLRRLVYNDPAAKAKAIREEAARLLQRAAQFESVAADAKELTPAQSEVSNV